MFPISNPQLPLSEIVNRWAAEIAPADASLRGQREGELLRLMFRAWLVGEMSASDDITRLTFLKHLFDEYRSEFTFLIPGDPEPEVRAANREDGGMVVEILLVVHLPNDVPASWTEEICGHAFSDLADVWDYPERLGRQEHRESWHYFEAVIPILMFDRDDVLTWASNRGFDRPIFWRAHPEVRVNLSENGPKISASSNSAALVAKTRSGGRRPKIRDAAVAKMVADVRRGHWSPAELADALEKELEARYGCSRDTARKAKAIALEKIARTMSDIADNSDK